MLCHTWPFEALSYTGAVLLSGRNPSLAAVAGRGWLGHKCKDKHSVIPSGVRALGVVLQISAGCRSVWFVHSHNKLLVLLVYKRS